RRRGGRSGPRAGRRGVVTDLGADPIDAMAFANLLEMTGGDQAFVDELVDTYLQEGASLVDRLRTAAATGAGDDLMRAAHSLKTQHQKLGAAPPRQAAPSP